MHAFARLFYLHSHIVKFNIMIKSIVLIAVITVFAGCQCGPNESRNMRLTKSERTLVDKLYSEFKENGDLTKLDLEEVKRFLRIERGLVIKSLRTKFCSDFESKDFASLSESDRTNLCLAVAENIYAAIRLRALGIKFPQLGQTDAGENQVTGVGRSNPFQRKMTNEQ